MKPFVEKSLEEIRREEEEARKKDLQLEQLVALNKSLMLTVTDLYEENIAFRELNRNIMLVVTDLYEKVFADEGEGDLQ